MPRHAAKDRAQVRKLRMEFGLEYAPPNQRLQLTLPPFGHRPLAMLPSFALMTPALLRGAAETHNR